MIEIRTLNLKIKNIEYKEEFDFDTSENFIEAYSTIVTDLNHLFLIHPPALDELEDIINLLKNKEGGFFIILLSSDAKSILRYNEKNIWIISYAITTPANFEIKEKFNNFYTEISKVKSAKDIDEIQTLIIKYLDPTHKLTPQIEQDLAYIYLWKSMSKDNITWTTLSRFENDNERIKKIEYFLRKLS